jgi:hypothetical protein
MLNISDGPFTPSGAASAVDDFPSILTYEDARGYLWNSPESELMLGVDSQNEPVTIDLDHDSPHIMVSAGSGAGKSVLAASLATQALVKGAHVVFLDVKLISHRWAKNLPETDYASEIHEIANALVSAAALIKRRMRIIDEFPGPVSEAPVGPRLVIVAEELNSMIEELREFEKTLPRRGVYRPLQAFGDIMNLGRAARVHVVGLGQYLDAQTVPKRWRESFGFKVLMRHTPDSWNMLAWQCGFCPPAPQQKGRGYVVTGADARMTQFLYMAEEQCAQLVRDAYDARVRMGLVTPPTRRELRRNRRELSRAVDELEG